MEEKILAFRIQQITAIKYFAALYVDMRIMLVLRMSSQNYLAILIRCCVFVIQQSSVRERVLETEE